MKNKDERDEDIAALAELVEIAVSLWRRYLAALGKTLKGKREMVTASRDELGWTVFVKEKEEENG